MSGSTSPVWRNGAADQWMVPPEGAEPVREVHKKNPRELITDHIHVTLYGHDGVWSVGSVALHGVWKRKTDGQPGTRTGSILLAGSLSVEDGAPDWLIRRAGKLVDALNRAYKEAEL
jgi:hypothetical protein